MPLKTSLCGKVIAARTRMKIHNTQRIPLVQVEILQSKNAFFFFLTCNLKKYFYYCKLNTECFNTKITAFISVETVMTGSLKRRGQVKLLWSRIRVYCASPVLRTEFTWNGFKTLQTSTLHMDLTSKNTVVFKGKVPKCH